MTDITESMVEPGVGSDLVVDPALPVGIVPDEIVSDEAVSDETVSDEIVSDETVSDATPPDEGDIAADYLEELLDLADLDGDIEITVLAGRVYLSIEAEEQDALRMLSKPDTVSALQELTRLAVHARTGDFSRLILDIAGSRDARAEELQRLVDRAVERIEAGASTAALPPMSSYERKLVHDLVGERGFTSESEGEGVERHTVIRRA